MAGAGRRGAGGRLLAGVGEGFPVVLSGVAVAAGNAHCVPVKGFGIVNKAEIDVFLELSCFFDDPVDVGNLLSGSSAFSKHYRVYSEV